jgi:hypothetical protein
MLGPRLDIVCVCVVYCWVKRKKCWVHTSLWGYDGVSAASVRSSPTQNIDSELHAHTPEKAHVALKKEAWVG